jgi:START domain
MKTKITYLLILLHFTFNSGLGMESPDNNLSAFSSSDKVNNKFTLVRSDDNISIYMRWIKVNDTTSTRQLKAKFMLDCPAENVVSVLRDDKSYTKWMKATKTCYRVKTINSNQWYSYVQFAIPWPLNNQDCILKYEVHANDDLSRTVITLVSVPGILESYNGIERISHLDGTWIITQFTPGRTCVEYYVCSKQTQKFPAWIVDPLIQKNLLNTMNALRDIVISISK